MSKSDDVYDLSPEPAAPRPPDPNTPLPPAAATPWTTYQRPAALAGRPRARVRVGLLLLGLIVAAIVILPIRSGAKFDKTEWTSFEAQTNPKVDFPQKFAAIYPLGAAAILVVVALAGGGSAGAGLAMLVGAGYFIASAIYTRYGLLAHPPAGGVDRAHDCWLTLALIGAWMLALAGGLGLWRNPAARAAQAAAAVGGLALLVIFLAPVWPDGGMLFRSAWKHGMQKDVANEAWRLTGAARIWPWLTGMGFCVLTALGGLRSLLPPGKRQLTPATYGGPAAGGLLPAVFASLLGTAALLAAGAALLACGYVGEQAAQLAKMAENVKGVSLGGVRYTAAVGALKMHVMPLLMATAIAFGLGELLALSGRQG
ncbi:MAG: hypothetical protein BIFFINMI_03747 [Phycisphaerae bacterium]|nr:hypothetical protein [Phycisphaerae bacterium]